MNYRVLAASGFMIGSSLQQMFPVLHLQIKIVKNWQNQLKFIFKIYMANNVSSFVKARKRWSLGRKMSSTFQSTTITDGGPASFTDPERDVRLNHYRCPVLDEVEGRFERWPPCLWWHNVKFILWPKTCLPILFLNKSKVQSSLLKTCFFLFFYFTVIYLTLIL